MESSFARFDVSDKIISDNNQIFRKKYDTVYFMPAPHNPSELRLGLKIRIRGSWPVGDADAPDTLV